ncbi:hypothetical protein SBA7_290003 [Candidatus Sulfotelmatobacter sp. SbA7]|nr:hypothetical protein SBA7_290003 [Candidatus Sulfotelmatobacter sp. SbA7]
MAPLDEPIITLFLEGDEVVRWVVNRRDGLVAIHQLCDILIVCRVEASDSVTRHWVGPNLATPQSTVWLEQFADVRSFIQSREWIIPHEFAWWLPRTLLPKTKTVKTHSITKGRLARLEPPAPKWNPGGQQMWDTNVGTDGTHPVAIPWSAANFGVAALRPGRILFRCQ